MVGRLDCWIGSPNPMGCFHQLQHRLCMSAEAWRNSFFSFKCNFRGSTSKESTLLHSVILYKKHIFVLPCYLPICWVESSYIPANPEYIFLFSYSFSNGTDTLILAYSFNNNQIYQTLKLNNTSHFNSVTS